MAAMGVAINEELTLAAYQARASTPSEVRLQGEAQGADPYVLGVLFPKGRYLIWRRALLSWVRATHVSRVESHDDSLSLPSSLPRSALRQANR